MKKIFKNRTIVLLIGLLILPAFLLIYNPSMKLGGLGLVLGGIGYYISPLLILLSLVYLFQQSGKNN